MSDVFDECSLLIEEVVKHLWSSRRTFTEREALKSVWEAGYEVSIQSDARFVLAQEGDWKHPSHWRLAHHTIANNRLLNDLLSGAWDGRGLDRKLVALDAEDQQHYVFCPLDPRLVLSEQGVMEPAERERNVTVPRSMKNTLDQLGPRLLTHWRETGAEPWTVRTITEMLKQLGWRDGAMPNAWLYVRSWLLGWPQVMRVGQDYWIPSDQLPREIQHSRLQVMPVRGVLPADTAAVDTAIATENPPVPVKSAHRLKADESQAVLGGEVTATHATWSIRLRTVHLLEGFLPVPSSARGAYPPPVTGEKQRTVLRGVWFEDNTHFWLWLDREQHRLYGPALAEKLAWLEAGDIVRIEWAADVIVLRLVGHDEEVQREESRLVDLEELAALRGGLGESYRRSLQAILTEAPEGLTFAEIVKSLRERQHHEVHSGTIRALLYNGGFIHKDRRWFAAPDADAAARQLRTAFVETLILKEQADTFQPISHVEYVRTRIKAIHSRLSEIVSIITKESRLDKP